MNIEWRNILFSTENVYKFTGPLIKIKDQKIDDNIICPNYNNILRAFNYFTPKDLRVVIIGQDPYPEPDESCGLSFSTKNKVISGSLRNINTAINRTYPEQILTNGCLEHWVRQGVLLLNRSLTTIKGKSNVHTKIWKPFTDFLVEFIDNLDQPIIFVLWGNNAKEIIPLLKKSRYVTWRHPSPMANTNIQQCELFINCDSFRLVNEFIKENKLGELITWGNKIIDLPNTKEVNDDIVKSIINESQIKFHKNPLENLEEVTIKQGNNFDPFEENIEDENLINIDSKHNIPNNNLNNNPIISKPIIKIINNINIWIPNNTKLCLSGKTVIFTDGAASNNGRVNAVASYAFLIKFGEHEGYVEKGEVIKTETYNPSNNRGELLGLLNSLQYILDNNIKSDLVIISDSSYTINMYNSWLDKWILEESINTKSNQDLIHRMIDIKTEIKKRNINVLVSFVESHATKPSQSDDDIYFIWEGNYEVDKLATSVTEKLLENIVKIPRSRKLKTKN